MQTYRQLLAEAELEKQEIQQKLDDILTVKQVLNKFGDPMNPVTGKYAVVCCNNMDRDLKYAVESWDFDKDTNSCILTVNDEAFTADAPGKPMMQTSQSLGNFPNNCKIFVKNKELFPAKRVIRDNAATIFVITY